MLRRGVCASGRLIGPVRYPIWIRQPGVSADHGGMRTGGSEVAFLEDSPMTTRTILFDSPFLLGFDQTRALIDRAARAAADS